MQTMTPQATIQNIYGHIALYLYVQKQVFQFQLMVTIMINFFHMLQYMLHVIPVNNST